MCSACIPLLVIRHENSKKYILRRSFFSPFTKGANHYGFFRHRRRRQINAKYYFFRDQFFCLASKLSLISQIANFPIGFGVALGYKIRSTCQKILVAGHETFTTLFWLLALCPKVSTWMEASKAKQAKNVYFSFILLICMMMCEKALPCSKKVCCLDKWPWGETKYCRDCFLRDGYRRFCILHFVEHTGEKLHTYYSYLKEKSWL